MLAWVKGVRTGESLLDTFLENSDNTAFLVTSISLRGRSISSCVAPADFGIGTTQEERHCEGITVRWIHAE